MARMIRILHVPESLHRKLKARAASLGKSMSDYLLGELGRIASTSTREEMLTRLHNRSRVYLRESAATVVRRQRDSP